MIGVRLKNKKVTFFITLNSKSEFCKAHSVAYAVKLNEEHEIDRLENLGPIITTSFPK